MVCSHTHLYQEKMCYANLKVCFDSLEFSASYAVEQHQNGNFFCVCALFSRLIRNFKLLNILYTKASMCGLDGNFSNVGFLSLKN